MKGLPRSLVFSRTDDNQPLLDARGSTGALPGSPAYLVSSFGAKADGVTDDTAAINAAIAAANANPGAIYLMKGVHRISGALTPITGDNISLIGCGEFFEGTQIRIDCNPIPAETLLVTGQYALIQGILIGKPYQALNTTSYAIKLQSFRPTVRNVTTYLYGNGFNIDASNGALLENCQSVDILGSYGFYAHGTNGVGFMHNTQYVRCLAAQSYPLSLTTGRGDWAISTAYTVGQAVRANGGLWQCSTSGTSAGSGTGPSGLPSTDPELVHTTTVADGTCAWRYAMGAFAGFAHGSFADTVMYDRCGTLQGDCGLRVFNDQGSAPSFVHSWQWVSDHCMTRGIELLAGDGAVYFDQTVVTSTLSGSGIEIGANAKNWSFNSGEVYGAAENGFLVAGSGGKITGFEVAAVSAVPFNTHDCIKISANTTDLIITGNTLGNLPGFGVVSRYGVSIASGCNNYIVAENIIIGNDTGTILNTPGVSPTRVIRNNLPDVLTTEIEETGAGPFNNYATLGASHIMASNAAGVFTGVDATSFRVGDKITFSHQGSGYTELQHFTGSTSGNLFINGRLGKTIRIYDNEVAIYQYLDITAGAGNGPQWVLINPQFPFANASDNVVGNVIVHNGTNWASTAGIAPSALAVVTSNRGVVWAERVSFAATGVTGTMIDVTIYNANAPFALRILSAELLVATAAGTGSALRTASAGGGSVILPDATAATQTFLTTTTGHKYDNSTVSATIAANGSVFFNVDRAVAGEIVLTCVRT